MQNKNETHKCMERGDRTLVKKERNKERKKERKKESIVSTILGILYFM